MSAVSGDDEAMAAALALGERGRLTASPNPWVGCVMVRDGEVVGRGFHRAAGEPHAEAVALAEAGERARGATAFLTLEPCTHFGRTPPCAPALIEAGVTRVVVAVVDPDPRVSGRGVEQLRAAGLSVEVGVGAEAAAASLAPYLHHRRTGRPLCLLKAAISLDGRTAAADGSSRWITGPEARADAHRLRAESQAVVVGAGTALADLPSLTVRHLEFSGDAPGPGPIPRQPLRVLLDARGRVPAQGPLFDPALAATLVLTSALAPTAVVKAWLEAGVDVEEVPPAPGGAGVSPDIAGGGGVSPDIAGGRGVSPDIAGGGGVSPDIAGGGGIDLAAALAVLGRRGVLQAMVEGGAVLHGALVRAGLADRMVLYVGGRLLGEAGRPLLAGPGPSTIDEASEWRLTAVRSLGGDVRLDYEPAGGPS